MSTAMNTEPVVAAWPGLTPRMLRVGVGVESAAEYRRSGGYQNLGDAASLLDEIAGGLTEGECTQLVATIRDIHASGMSIIWIEHVLHALNSVVERLLVLDFGKVIGIGKPDEIMASREVREIYLGIEV